MIKLRLKHEIENKKLEWELQKLEMQMMLEKEKALAEAQKTKWVGWILIFNAYFPEGGEISVCGSLVHAANHTLTIHDNSLLYTGLCPRSMLEAEGNRWLLSRNYLQANVLKLLAAQSFSPGNGSFADYQRYMMAGF